MIEQQQYHDSLLNRLRGSFVYSCRVIALPASPLTVVLCQSDPARIYLQFIQFSSGFNGSFWPLGSNAANAINIVNNNVLLPAFTIDEAPGLVQAQWFGQASLGATSVTVVEVFSSNLG